jgi:hypothetical protein
MSGTGYLFRPRAVDDDPALVDLFNDVFGAGKSGFRPLSVEDWRWKFARNPAGSRHIVAEDERGALVGHYGGVPVRVRLDGADVLFSQNCDCFTALSARRGLKNPGLVVRLAQAYASTYARGEGDAVMYGVGNAEAYRLGVRYLDYWMLRTQPLLLCDDPRRLPEWDWATHAAPLARFDARADAFADRPLRRIRCAARRDAAFLNWRFCEAPGGPYRIFFARSGDRDDYRGHAVCRIHEFGGRRLCLLMDWWIEADDDGAARSLLRRVAEYGNGAGVEGVGFLCPVSSPWFLRFQDWGFRTEPSGYVACARPYDPRVTSDYLRAHWWYTFADFDVV